MPNIHRAKEKTCLAVTAHRWARTYYAYLRGVEYAVVEAGDAVEKDTRWLAEMENSLLRCGFWTKETVKHVHENKKWAPDVEVYSTDQGKAAMLLNFELSMEGLARLHDRCLRGLHQSSVLGDALDGDYRFIGFLERELLGHDYLTVEEINRRHMLVDPHWKIEFDRKESEGA